MSLIKNSLKDLILRVLGVYKDNFLSILLYSLPIVVVLFLQDLYGQFISMHTSIILGRVYEEYYGIFLIPFFANMFAWISHDI